MSIAEPAATFVVNPAIFGKEKFVCTEPGKIRPLQ
jgi:hypothetical protein